MSPRIRATAVLIEDGKLLLLKQAVTESSARAWSLPGGGLEFGEPIGDCLVREMKEETGLDVDIERLLYVCDRIEDGRHVVHMTFLVRRTAGRLQLGAEPEAGANEIHACELVDIDRLSALGFSERFQHLLSAGFPNAGAYMGAIANIGL